MAETVLAFDVETLRLASEVEEKFAPELARESAWTRPDLFGFGCGATEDVEAGEADRHAPGDSGQMLKRLKEADLTVTCNEIVSELGILEVLFDSALREKHLNLVVEYEFEETNAVVGYGKDKDGAALSSEGRTEELLDLSEFRARWAAEAYRVARHLQTGSPRAFVERRDGAREDLALSNITVGYAWGPGESY